MATQQQDDTPSTVSELATACVRFVEKALALRLDFTADTLPILDHYLERARREQKTEVFGLIAPAAGAYFGEVVRRHVGDGRWHCPDDDYAAWRLEFSQCFLHFNPIGVSIESLQLEEDESYNGHFQVLDTDRALVNAAVGSMGEKVPESDFYRLTTRLEVIEQIHSSLRRNSRGLEKGPQVFDHAVYDAIVHGRMPTTPLN